MSGILGTAQAGLQRATLGVQTVASNIARLNVGTDRASGPSDPLGQSQASDVNLLNELVDLKRHEHAFSASATLIDFEDRRLGELLDLIA